MKLMTLNVNGQFYDDSNLYMVAASHQARLPGDEPQGYISLYRNGAEHAFVSETDLECSGVTISNMQEFKDVLQITMDDNWGMAKYKFSIPDMLVTKLYADWKGGATV